MINLVTLLLAVSSTFGEHQYYHQDGHGDYDDGYGYDGHLNSQHESGDHSGFSYVDGDGHLQSAYYTADGPEHHGHYLQYAGGYGHESHHYKYHGPPAPLKHDGTVDYTPEVKKARAEHFAALEAHKHGYPQYVQPLYSHGNDDYSHYHYEPSTYAGGYSHEYKYHGPPAPLKHDGTVDDLPEVKAARAHHLAEYAKVLYSRHKRGLYGYGAPLKHDGTVDETPEVKHAKAEHLAAVAHAKSLSYAPYHDDYYYNNEHDGQYHHNDEHHSHDDGQYHYNDEHHSHDDGQYHYNDEHDSHDDGQYHYNDGHDSHDDGQYHHDYDSYHHDGHYYNDGHDDGHKYHGPPAPLNHDGTVADTPAVKHAKAIHFAAHHAAKARLHGVGHYASHYDHSNYRSHYSHYDYPHKYHGPPAPLNHDGTVAETPEVKHAKAVHFALYHKFQHRHKRSPIFDPAPLHPDGTVDETPEVKQAKAAFLAAYSAEAAFADHSWVEPKHYEEPVKNRFGYSSPAYHDFSRVRSHQLTPIHHTYDVAVHSSHSDFSAPAFEHDPGFKKSTVPAPLNHDGTVADTPEIRAAKAIHFAAHQDALSRITTGKQQRKPYNYV